MNRAEWEKLKKSSQPSNPYIFGNTSIDVLGNILQGAVKGLEGIYDISATAVGAVGGLFDKEFQKSVQERIKFDYTSWLFNPNDMKKDTQGSLINKLGDKGQMIARGTAQGLGQMLPAIGANVLLPGSGLATLGVSAAGTGTESAYNEGADYGEGAAYGILSGVVEMATEKLTGGFTKGVVGKGLLDDAIDGALKKVGKSALFKVAKNFAEEGFEEMLATAIEPTLRSIYQEGAYKETFSKEHTEQMLYDGLIGGLTSMAYGGTIGQIGKSTRNVSESIEEYNKIDAKKTALWEKGKLDDATELKLNAEKEATQVELKKRLSKLSDERRAQIIKDYKLDIDDKGNFRTYESEEGYNKSAYSATLHGKEKSLRYKPVKGEVTAEQKQAIKLHSDLNKISRVKTDIVIAEDLGTIDGNKIGATFENGVMYIDSSINDETLLKRKIIHEMTHSTETIGKGAYATYRDALLKAMETNEDVKKLLDPKGNLWKSTVERYKSQLEGKTEYEQAYIVTTELIAQYSEVLFTDAKVIERLTQDNRNIAQKLYNKIKNLITYWQSRKGKTAQEKDYLAFLRNAEKMYKAALESTEQRSDLKTVRAIGEKIESKPTAKTDTERMSIEDISSLEDLKNKYADYIEKSFFYERESSIKLDSIRVKKEFQNQGIGTRFMKDLIKYADKVNKIINLTPDTSFGASSVSRLESFYKRFGFKKNTNLQYLDKMIRYPNNARYSLDSDGNALSEAQQEFFKDSKVRDEQGRLLKVYHGTPFNTFYKFKGNMFFFSESEKFAREYAEDKSFAQGMDATPTVYKVYLNGKKVLNTRDKNQIGELFDSIDEKNMKFGFANKTYSKKEWLDGMLGLYDLPPQWSNDKIAKAKYGHVIGEDRNGYNNDLFIGIDKDNMVVYVDHSNYPYLDSLSENQRNDLMNGKIIEIKVVNNGYSIDDYKRLYEKEPYSWDIITRKIRPYKTTQEITKLTGQDNWSLLELTYDQETKKTVIDYIKDLGYDTIIMFENGQKNYAVFNPNQIKLTTNENPTDDDDIRYSIEDFGEKIGGARKDVWMKRGLQSDDLEYLNDAELEKYVKKDYVWRPINYQKMLSEGTQRGTLYLMKATRDSIPATLYIFKNASKVETENRRKIYVDTINKIRDGIAGVKSADDLSKLSDDIFIKTGYIEKRGDRYAATQLFHENPALDVALFNNWQKIIKMYDRLDSWAEREKIGLGKTEKALGNYSIQQHDDGKYYIYQKTWMGYSQISDTGFDNEEVANTILRMAVEKDQAGKQVNRKQRIVPPQLETINRKGIDYRSNKNVTGDDYLKVFKFRGGEFGNWLSELDRQTSLNYGYDALMDLADALNIEKENISLNGDLAIAFGARGQGLSGAAAHYEPERRVINLTKMNGAGSLAHEWFHAVDKYIAGKDTTSLFSQLYSYQRKAVPEKTSKAFDNVIDTMKYVTRKQTDAEIDMRLQHVYDSAKKVVDRAFKDYFTNFFEEDMTPERLAIYGKNRRNATVEEKKQYQELKNRVYDGDTAAWAELDKLRKTVTNKQIPRGDGASSYTYDQVFYQIYSLNKENIKKAYGTEEAPTIHEETTYFKNSKRMGEISQKDGGYWESPEEMLARAFATYIQDKTNAGNDYLTAHAEAMATLDVDKKGKEYVLKAYPEGEERKRINAAFDKLFVAMKEDGFFKEFEGTRPIQIISYHSNKEGKSGQDLFTQEPISERKDLPIKEEIAAKETSSMPTPKEFYTKPTQMNLFDGEINKNIQLSLFDDNTRFSILAADGKTMYNEKEIKAAMESALAEALNLGNFEYGELSKMAEKDMMVLFENELKNSKDIDATAKKIAEFIVMNATVENAMAEDDGTPEDYKTYNILKTYRNKFNLDGIKEDIKHAFGNDTTAFLHWGKRKGMEGVTADVIAKELEGQGIYIDSTNEADIFIKFVEMYKDVSDKVNGRAKEIKKTVGQTTNGFIVDSIIDDLSNDIKGILDKSSRKALPSDVAREKNKQISELRKQVKELANKIAELETQYGEETEKSNEYRMEMYHLQYKIDRLNLEIQDTKSYSEYLSKSLKIVREDVKNVTNRLANEMVKHRLENRLFERIDRVKNLTNYAGSGVQYADEVIALVKVLKKAKTWRGQLSSNIREIMRTYARTIDGKALYDILAKSENDYGQAIQSIANGTGDLSNSELRVLAEIFDNFVHNVNEYDRVFFEGRKQSERELAEHGIKDNEAIVPFKQGSIAKMWQRFDNWLESPIWRFSRLSNYDDNGVMSRMFWEITEGLKKQESFNMKVAEYFKPFISKNKSIAKSWRKVITINGVQMSKGQAMGLYLSSLRDQAKTHIYNKTETTVTEDGISVKRKGIIRLVDESLAEKSLREAQEKGHNIEVTEEFINGLFSEFTTEERQFIRLAYDFFNTMSAEAKTETDMALYGVAGNLEKHYYPIRVADDQIYKQLGNQKPFGDLFTVFNPSFTKKTTQNANNVVVIENILDVVNRHSRQMAAYYGLAQPIKAFNRIWNAKTEKGTLKQAVMKVDSGFEHYVSQLFNDMQGNNDAKEGFDKVLSKMRSFGATAALGLNPKVWTNQTVSLLAAKGVGFKYQHLMAGLAKAIAGKTDFETLTKLSPIMYSRFRDGHNIDAGLLKEGKGITGKVGTFTEATLAPITWMDKMMIGSIWNAALAQYGDEAKAAKMVEKAVIISQANYTPLFRPAILRSHSSALQLMTMFMSEPLQMYSQLAGAVDKLRVAHFLKNNAKSAEEIEKADKLLAKAKEDGRHAFTAISVDMVMLSFIAMLFDWIKGKDDDDKTFSEKFGNEMLANIMGMFPIAREIYSLSQGFDITNMAYTGLTNIYNAANEIFGSAKGLITGEYQSPQEIQGGIRKTIVGFSQAFGIPVRNLETYLKGITEKFAPGAVETYESLFYKKSEKAYQDMMTEALAKGDDKFADTLAGLILDNKLTISNKTVIDETKRLYLKGFDSMPSTINKTMTYVGKEYELTARDFKQFAETYSGAEKDVEKLISSYQYKRLSDDDKSAAIRLIYDYYYNVAKSELVGEDVSAEKLVELQKEYDEKVEMILEYQNSNDSITKEGRKKIDLMEKELQELKNQVNLSKLMEIVDEVGLAKLAIILSRAKNLTADKDEQGKSISGSKKYKIEQAMIGLYLTAKQKNAIMDYLGYSIN